MWATAPGSEEFKASDTGCNKSFLYVLHVSIRKEMCRNGSLKLMFWWLAGLPVLLGCVTQLESLILAQNERWRHA